MAHFILEYSTNLDPQQLNSVGLLGALIDAAVATEVFPRAGCRGRAHPCDEFYVGDGREDFGFVHLQVRLGGGRSDEEKQLVKESLVAVLQQHLASLYDSQGLAISFELVELPEVKANINNLRDYLGSL